MGCADRTKPSKGDSDMALSRTFKETVCARAQHDPAYRDRMLQEAVHALIAGDMESAKSLLQLYVNATVGFQELGRAMEMAPQSLTRMLGPDGNPRANNLCAMLAFLQREAGVELTVDVRKTGATEHGTGYAAAGGSGASGQAVGAE
jgi:DNA-binding phage protein